MIDLNTNGIGVGGPYSSTFAMSDDALFFAFDHLRYKPLVPNDNNNGTKDVFVRRPGGRHQRFVFRASIRTSR